jgi:hypothetical protein
LSTSLNSTAIAQSGGRGHDGDPRSGGRDNDHDDRNEGRHRGKDHDD